MLVTNSLPICAAALEAERDTFFNPLDRDPKIAGLTGLMTEAAVVEDPDVVVLDTYAAELQLTLPDRSRAFLHFLRYPGCGGGCEGSAVAIDAERIVEEHFEAMPRVVPRADRYGPNRWRLFKSSDGDFYLRGTVDDHTQWYRVAAPDRWELVCDIALKPDTSSGERAVYPQQVFDAVDSLRIAAGRMAGGAGNCGSMGTPWRWAQYREEGLKTALYRPWAVVERHGPYRSENSGGDYERIVKQFELWSLGGSMEYRAFAEYRTQFDRTAAIVSKFYQAKFRWPQPRAAQMADAALKGAISSGFGFYYYEPYPGRGERELRQAILSKAPIEKIRGLDVDVQAIDRADEDSVLNVALEYPEALSYLLERGFNPNIGNAFGKTPLMYAAQYNQLAAAEKLLAAGADPNATTHPPEDTCAYTIRTHNLTPLHYATRYASTPLIKLLLDRGAVTFIQSVGESGAEYPLARLQRYAGIGVKEERNPHIAGSEVAELAPLLAVPSNAQKLTMANDLVARARSEYSRGDMQPAYQHMRLALLAQPDRPDAIADLPLMALRAGYIGPAISAADRAIKTLTSPAAIASSWFNKGLICEQPRPEHVFTVDGARCELDTLDPYVQSWKAQPSRASANKLRALIKERAASCGPINAGRHYRVAPSKVYRTYRLYALHRPDDRIDAPADAKVLDSVSLPYDAVTLWEVPVRSSDGYPKRITISIEGRECAAEL